MADDAGHEDEVVGDEVLVLLPHRPLVLVTGVGRLERDLSDVRAQHRLQDVLQFDVGRVRAVPRTPAQVQADLFLRQTLDGLVDRIDAELREGVIVRDARLRLDLVPVLGKRRVVELQDEARVGDGLVLLAQRARPRGDVLVLGLVEARRDASRGSGGDRRDEATLAVAERVRQVRDVAGDLVVPRVGDLARVRRERGRILAGADAGGAIRVRLREQLAIAPVEERGQLNVARRALDALIGEEGVVGQLESRHALERVAPPGAVVDRVRHGLAELPISGLGDAGAALPLDDVRDGRRDELAVLRRRGEGEAVVLERAGRVGLDQLRSARQAPGGGGLDPRHSISLGWVVIRRYRAGHRHRMSRDLV